MLANILGIICKCACMLGDLKRHTRTQPTSSQSPHSQDHLVLLGDLQNAKRAWVAQEQSSPTEFPRSFSLKALLSPSFLPRCHSHCTLPDVSIIHTIRRVRENGQSGCDSAQDPLVLITRGRTVPRGRRTSKWRWDDFDVSRKITVNNEALSGIKVANTCQCCQVH
jgi:hypothetical protein